MSREKDRAVKAKIEGAPARSTHNAYTNYLQYKRMDKADPSGALKSRIKARSRKERGLRKQRDSFSRKHSHSWRQAMGEKESNDPF